MKSGFVLLLGRPSSGKSTLINTILDFKVSIVSPIPQTTRRPVRGIWTTEAGQAVLLDTPGIHFSEKKFNQKMMGQIDKALEDQEMVLYLVDLSRKPGKEERAVVEKLTGFQGPVIIVMNKCDLEGTYAGEYQELFEQTGMQSPSVEISALKGKGIQELEELVFSNLPLGEQLYPEDYLTDQAPNFRVAEIIREQVFQTMSQEIPHSVFVEVADLEIPEDGKMWIRAFIIAERESQKGMLVGKGGSRIKVFRQKAQKELGKIFSQRIHLDLRVKVIPKWRQKDRIISRLLDPDRE